MFTNYQTKPTNYIRGFINPGVVNGLGLGRAVEEGGLGVRMLV